MQTVWELVQLLEKVLADVVEEDMLDLHKYIGGSHLCPLKIVAIGLTLQI